MNLVKIKVDTTSNKTADATGMILIKKPKEILSKIS